MKKVILLASAALAFGGVAYAQDSSTPMSQPGTTSPDAASQPTGSPAMSAPGTPAPAPDAGSPPMAPDSSGSTMTPPPAGGDMSGGAMPPSGGAMPPSGGMSPPSGSATGPSGPVSMTPTQGPTDLPTCSKTVTDNCKQGAGGGKSHGHRAMHHKKK